MKKARRAGLARPAARAGARPGAAGRSWCRTTSSAASGCCSPTPGTPPSPSPTSSVVTEPVAEVLPARRAQRRRRGARGRRGHLRHRVRGHRVPRADAGHRRPAAPTCRSAGTSGARAYLGLCVPDFPNLFVVYGPNTNLGGSSIINMLEAASGAITTLLRHTEHAGAPAVAVRPEVEERFDERDPAPARDQRLGGVPQLVPPGRRPDHHQLAGPGRGVPAALRRARPRRLRDDVAASAHVHVGAAPAVALGAAEHLAGGGGDLALARAAGTAAKLRTGLPSVHSK